MADEKEKKVTETKTAAKFSFFLCRENPNSVQLLDT